MLLVYIEKRNHASILSPFAIEYYTARSRLLQFLCKSNVHTTIPRYCRIFAEFTMHYISLRHPILKWKANKKYKIYTTWEN